MSQNNEIQSMTDKSKKIDREYVLSDSSVNEYGFRLLTTGYQIEAFRKNPIGYYMHRRDDGIALKWDDLRIEDDKILATPVINLSNPRGEQICDEAGNGFLNAASMGHIVVLEYSTEPEMMLPGQTGPTITKWYNKECSLVDIPGNGNALSKLYDERENEINLVDLNAKPMMALLQPAFLKRIADTLQLTDTQNEAGILTGVQDLASANQRLELENKMLRSDKQALQQQIDAMAGLQVTIEVSALLDRGLEDKKLTPELRDKLAKDYATNPTGLKELIAAMPAYRSIVDNLAGRKADNTEAIWEWDDYEKNDPTGNRLKDLRANDPIHYKELFNKKFVEAVR